jgi:hypothetical protein
MTKFSRRNSLNVLQQQMVERLTPWAYEVAVDSHLRYVGRSTGRFTAAEHDKATWVYNNRQR